MAERVSVINETGGVDVLVYENDYADWSGVGDVPTYTFYAPYGPVERHIEWDRRETIFMIGCIMFVWWGWPCDHPGYNEAEVTGR